MDLKVKDLTTYTRKPWTTIVVTKENLASLRSNREYYEDWGRGRQHRTAYKNSPAGKSQINVSVEGEGLWDDFENRTSRPYTLWAQPIKDALIAAGFPKDVKLRWSQKAGCGCGCSPAFFIEGGPRGIDFSCTIVADTVQADPDAKAHRHAALVADPTLPVMA